MPENPKSLRIAINGVTGRMGYRQHLVRSILPIREQGGVDAGRRHRGAGRSRSWSAATRPSSRELAERHGVDRLDHRPGRGARRRRRRDLLRRPGDLRREAARSDGDRGRQAHLHREADRRDRSTRRSSWPGSPSDAGVKHGVVQDKLFLPGLLKLRRLVDERLLRPDPVACAASSATGCSRATGSRPSARPGTTAREDGGGIDRRHVLPLELRAGGHLRPGRSRSPRKTATHIPTRWDEQGKPYAATADDAAYGIFELERRRSSPRSTPPGRSGSTATSWSSSRSTAPTAPPSPGCATAGPAPRRTPRSRCGTPTCRPPSPSATSGRRCRTTPSSTTASRCSGRCSCATSSPDAPYRWDLLAGARGVQLAELGLRSSAEGRRLEVPEITL